MSSPNSSARDQTELKSFIQAVPELRDAEIAVFTHSYDSIALDVGGQFIVKLPRNSDAELRLRKEARVLAGIRPHLAMRLPDMELFETPRLYSWHAKILGEHLSTAQYFRLEERSKQQLAVQLGKFYAELHALNQERLKSIGTLPIGKWIAPELILLKITTLLPNDLLALATRAIRQFNDLPVEPHGEVFGYFDGHGWNMAFDHEQQMLNGIYDFSDSGFGVLHQEFIYSNFISADLTARIVTAYERFARKNIDRERVWLLTAMLRLSELAQVGHIPDILPQRLRAVEEWLLTAKLT